MAESCIYLYRDYLKDKSLTNVEALLLSKLVDLSKLRSRTDFSEDLICKPTNKYLAKILYLKSFTINKYLQGLEEKGFIKILYGSFLEEALEFHMDDLFFEDEEYRKSFNWRFAESTERKIIISHIVPEYKTIRINNNYLRDYTHKQAITFSYLDSILRIPRFNISKKKLAEVMGVYNFNNIKKRLEDYPNLDRIDRYKVYIDHLTDEAKFTDSIKRKFKDIRRNVSRNNKQLDR